MEKNLIILLRCYLMSFESFNLFFKSFSQEDIYLLDPIAPLPCQIFRKSVSNKSLTHLLFWRKNCSVFTKKIHLTLISEASGHKKATTCSWLRPLFEVFSRIFLAFCSPEHKQNLLSAAAAVDQEGWEGGAVLLWVFKFRFWAAARMELEAQVFALACPGSSRSAPSARPWASAATSRRPGRIVPKALE